MIFKAEHKIYIQDTKIESKMIQWQKLIFSINKVGKPNFSIAFEVV